MTDYMEAGETSNGLVDLAGTAIAKEQLWLALRAYRGVLQRTAERSGGRAKLSLAGLVAFLRNPHVDIEKLDKAVEGLPTETMRARLAGALELAKNQQSMLYGMLSRSVINFPLAEDRVHILATIKGFFSEELLAGAKEKAWLKMAHERSFPLKGLSVLSSTCASELLTLVLPKRAVAQEGVVKRQKAETAEKREDPPLRFRLAVMEGTCGGPPPQVAEAAKRATSPRSTCRWSAGRRPPMPVWMGSGSGSSQSRRAPRAFPR